MSDRISGISEFTAVVNHGSFAAAARKLNLSRSAVGKAVARLEERLGVRLIHRTTRALTLTAEGQAYFEHCQRALAELDAGSAALESGQIEPRGTVRISVPVVFGRNCVAPVLYEAARRYPGLRLEIGFTDRQVNIVEEGYDLAIRNATPSDSAGLKARVIARQTITVCGSPDYLAEFGVPVSVDELERHPAILYLSAGMKRDWLFAGPDGRPFQVKTHGTLALDDLEAIRDAAVAGMGLAWLPCWLVRNAIATGTLVQVLTDVPAISFNSWAIWPEANHLPSRVRVLIDALSHSLPAMMR